MTPETTPKMQTEKDPSRYLRRHIWYLSEAQEIIRDLQKILWPMGYHVTLGGGVLNHGHSNNDLDLYVLPIYREDTLTSVQALIAIEQFFHDYDDNQVSSTRDIEHECFSDQVRFTNTKTNKSVEVFIVRR